MANAEDKSASFGVGQTRRKRRAAGHRAAASSNGACVVRPRPFFLSALTLGELRKGVDNRAASDRRSALFDWLEMELPPFFSGRNLPVDSLVGDCWGCLMAAAGRLVPAIDRLFGATAAQHGLGLVTCNVRNFADRVLGVSIPGAGEAGAASTLGAVNLDSSALPIFMPRTAP